MAVFPLFVDLKGKTCIVVGGGLVAYRKAEVLLQFEPKLTVVSPELCSSMEELGRQGKITILNKRYSEQDIDGSFLVIAATSSPEVNGKVFRDAIKRNIPVNTVDDIEKCTFVFPSLVKRGDLVIGISTSGNYPALSKKIRKKTEEIYTEEYAEILPLLKEFRIKVQKSNLSRDNREKLLRQVLDRFFDEGNINGRSLSRILEEHESELQKER